MFALELRVFLHHLWGDVGKASMSRLVLFLFLFGNIVGNRQALRPQVHAHALIHRANPL